MQAIRIGTAGWNIPRQSRHMFPDGASVLERYASQLNAVEINSSFYRSHRLSTWSRWREITSGDFRFSVKMPKLITHQHKLADCSALIENFLGEVTGLAEKLAVVLLQLPPKLAFDEKMVRRFFESLRAKTSIPVACEPRHASWFTPEVDSLLIEHEISRVAADPAICPAAAQPAGWRSLRYWRLHGSPEMYRSSYGDRLTSYLTLLEDKRDGGHQSWCIFDNTASGAAIRDALDLSRLVTEGPHAEG